MRIHIRSYACPVYVYRVYVFVKGHDAKFYTLEKRSEQHFFRLVAHEGSGI